ncbi:MAG TPA: glutamate 5-kinase [Gammaproteobacteria bacterium]|nr:glutamate 5-kinase [Gammaproteobacteria bacterium]
MTSIRFTDVPSSKASLSELLGAGFARLQAGDRLVIKIGSALLTAGGSGLDHQAISRWVAEMVTLQQRGVQLLLVSSGAVAEGMRRLGWQQRPTGLNLLQAAAAVGQMGLIQQYEQQFKQHGLQTAQILLTHDDLANRTRYLNARSALIALLEMGVIPVVNENDTVVTDEIRFGDNDTLGGLVANLVEARLLLILTDQQGLYEADPRHNPQARLVQSCRATSGELDQMAGGSGLLGRGGMQTKLRAARLAARSGAHTLISHGAVSGVIADLADGVICGTLLQADREPVVARKQWLAGHLHSAGKLVLDDGAVNGVCHRGGSLLAVGVIDVNGDFGRGDLVVCVDQGGHEIARGLINYGAHETLKIIGQPSSRISELLGYVDEEELIHRDNMVLV